MLIDAATGKHPLNTPSKSPLLPVCIPCDSPYLGVQNTSALYSVWNAKGNASSAVIAVGGAASAMRGLIGTCFPCPNFYDTTVDRDVLCKIKDGCGVVPAVTKVFAYVPIAGQEAVEDMSKTSLVSPTEYGYGPIPGAPTPRYVSYCCGTIKDRISQRGCYLFTNGLANAPVYLDTLSKNPICMYNTTVPFNESQLANYTNLTITIHRRLLQQQPLDTVVGQCLTGTFTSSGGGRCVGCPMYASTQYPWNGVTDPGLCACLPGFLSRRDASGALIGCLPCPTNSFSLYPMVDDSVCLDCPSGTDSIDSQVIYSLSKYFVKVPPCSS